MSESEARVAVLGAGGFIGGHLVARLLEEGQDVIAVDSKDLSRWWQRFGAAHNVTLDMRNQTHVDAILRDVVDVYNLAADMGGMGFIESHRADCMLSVLVTANVLRAAIKYGNVRRVFYSSSACVYPQGRQDTTDVQPLREEDAYPADPEDGYGWEKLFGERLHRHASEDYDLVTRVARYHNVYGPHGTWTGGREKAPAAICRKVAEAVFTGSRSIEIWGDGEQVRSFMYVGDCVEGTRRLMECHDRQYPGPLNVGSDETVTVNQLVDVVEEIAGVKLEREYILDAPQGVRGRTSDNTLIRNVLDWEPSTSLRVGLQYTYEWIREQMR